jgi:hypothetical protein
MKNGFCQQLLFSGSALSPLCHPDRSAAQWRDLRFSGPFLEMFFDRGVMGLWPAFGLPKVMKNGSYSATTLPGSTALPFVISTEAYPDFLLRAAGNDHVCGFP